MLNLYLAPRGFKAPSPPPAAVSALLEYLVQEQIVGALVDGAYPPGPAVARFFHMDMADSHLPAELTFDAMRVVQVTRPRFLPEQRLAGSLRAACGECGDPLDPDLLEEALAKLRYLPAERFSLTCAACRAPQTLRDLAFETTVGYARFWLILEGAGANRLNPHLVERLGRHLGVTLTVVPEYPVDAIEDWVPARRAHPRR